MGPGAGDGDPAPGSDLVALARQRWDGGDYRGAVDPLRQLAGAESPSPGPMAYALVTAQLLSGDPALEQEGATAGSAYLARPDAHFDDQQRFTLARAVAWQLVEGPHPDPAAVAHAEQLAIWGASFAPDGRPDGLTLALVRLRQGRAADALPLVANFRAVPPPGTTAARSASALAVQSLALAAGGDQAGATTAAASARQLDPACRLLNEAESSLVAMPGTGLAGRATPAPVVAPPAGVAGTAPTCYRHQGRTAGAECMRCHQPICADCMVAAPVGFQCPTCVKAGQKRSPVIRYQPGAGQLGNTRLTPAVIGLIVVNVICFVASKGGNDHILNRFGMVPMSAHPEPYRLFDSIFLHVSILHIGLNMFSLVIVGPPVEHALGRIRFLALYLVAGLGGSFACYLLSPWNSLGVGASGAIFGIFGAYFVIARHRRFDTTQIVGLIVANLVFSFIDPTISWQAHVGGLVVGAGVAFGFTRAEHLGRNQPKRLLVEIGTCVVMLVAFLGLFQIERGPNAIPPSWQTSIGTPVVHQPTLTVGSRQVVMRPPAQPAAPGGRMPASSSPRTSRDT